MGISFKYTLVILIIIAVIVYECDAKKSKKDKSKKSKDKNKSKGKSKDSGKSNKGKYTVQTFVQNRPSWKDKGWKSVSKDTKIQDVVRNSPSPKSRKSYNKDEKNKIETAKNWLLNKIRGGSKSNDKSSKGHGSKVKSHPKSKETKSKVKSKSKSKKSKKSKDDKSLQHVKSHRSKSASKGKSVSKDTKSKSKSKKKSKSSKKSKSLKSVKSMKSKKSDKSKGSKSKSGKSKGSKSKSRKSKKSKGSKKKSHKSKSKSKKSKKSDKSKGTKHTDKSKSKKSKTKDTKKTVKSSKQEAPEVFPPEKSPVSVETVVIDPIIDPTEKSDDTDIEETKTVDIEEVNSETEEVIPTNPPLSETEDDDDNDNDDVVENDDDNNGDEEEDVDANDDENDEEDDDGEAEDDVDDSPVSTTPRPVVDPIQTSSPKITTLPPVQTTHSSVHCVRDGNVYEVGLFDDPNDACTVCECFETGEVECMAKSCTPPKCGKDMQILSDDGCCMICKPECSDPTCPCPRLTCGPQKQRYRDDSCCPECTCPYKGKRVFEGQIGDRCDNCTCADGRVTCMEKPCPDHRLQCVDPALDENCNFVCPNGKTCAVGNTILKYGEIKLIGNKICTCALEWFPNGFCAPKRLTTKTKQIQKSHCVEHVLLF